MMDMNNQLSMFDSNPEYDAFVEKFKPKKKQTIAIPLLQSMRPSENGPARSMGLNPSLLSVRSTPVGIMRAFPILMDVWCWTTHPFPSSLKSASFTWTGVSRSFCLPRLLHPCQAEKS